MRFLVLAGLLATVLADAGCCPGCNPSAELIADVQTDFVLGEEADELVLVLDGVDARTISVVGRSALALPLRLDPLTVSTGEHALGVRLVRMGTPVLSRTVRVRVTGPITVVPIWLLRSCAQVSCPETGATECEDGRCVRPECVPLEAGGCEEVEPCPEGGCTEVPPACDVDADCVAPVAACAVAVCSDGRCLTVPLDLGEPAACDTEEYCDPATTCVPRTVPPPEPPEEPPVSYGPDVDAGMLAPGTITSPSATCCDRVCEVGGVVTRCCGPASPL